MSGIARFPSDHNFSEAELRKIACDDYCSLAGGNHLDRIARRVNQPVSVIRQWHKEDNWILKRATIQAQKHDEKLAQLAAMLGNAGVPDSKADALDTLKLLQDAKAVARSYLKQLPDRYYPEALDKILAAMERIEKLSKSAYDRL